MQVPGVIQILSHDLHRPFVLLERVGGCEGSTGKPHEALDPELSLGRAQTADLPTPGPQVLVASGRGGSWTLVAHTGGVEGGHLDGAGAGDLGS